MGTWGPGNFENDPALDIVEDVLKVATTEIETLCTSDRVEIDIWLERAAGTVISLMSEKSELNFIQLNQGDFEYKSGIFYKVVGRICHILNKEIFFLETLFPLRVDLDLTSQLQKNMPPLKVGDLIQIEGKIRAEIKNEIAT